MIGARHNARNITDLCFAVRTANVLGAPPKRIVVAAVDAHSRDRIPGADKRREAAAPYKGLREFQDNAAVCRLASQA